MSKLVIGIFEETTKAAEAVKALREAGFSGDHVSLLANDADELRPVASHLIKSGPDKFVTTMGIAGAISGLLVGLATIAIPGTGSLLVAGPMIAAMTGAAAGGLIGVISGALVHFDVPEYEAKLYEGHLTAGNILVAVHTDIPEDRFKAERIMDSFGALEIDTKAA